MQPFQREFFFQFARPVRQFRVHVAEFHACRRRFFREQFVRRVDAPVIRMVQDRGTDDKIFFPPHGIER